MASFTRFSWLGLVFAAATPAFAQSFTPQGTILDAGSASFTGNGVGAATTVWDNEQQRFMLFFETRIANASTACPAGEWGIGVATSTDGNSWSVFPGLAVAPTPGTFYSCYASQPAVVKDDNGEYNLWFQAGQRADACASSTPAWGCSQALGLGHVRGIVELDDKSGEIIFYTQRIQQLEQDKLALFAQWSADLADLRDDLEAVLECTNNATFCAPCNEYNAQINYTRNKVNLTHQFCQPFSFDIPESLTVLQGSAGASGNAVLTFGLNNYNTFCKYKGNNAFDDFERVVGQCPPTSGVINQFNLEISQARRKPLLVDLTFLSNGVVSQSFQGGGVQTVDALLAALAAGDEALVFSLAPQLDSQLLSLIIATDPADAVAGVGRSDIVAYLSQLTTINSEIVTAEAALAAAEAYEPTVALARTANVPVLTAARAGFPAVAYKNGQFEMVYARLGSLYRGTSADGVSWTFDNVNPVLAKGVTPWAQDEIFSPSLVCENDGSVTNFFGGRVTNLGIPGAAISMGAIGRATSTTMLSWAVEALLESFTGDNAYRHLDVVRSGGSYRMFYTERDSLGRTRIGMATDGGNFVPGNTASRSCD